MSDAFALRCIRDQSICCRPGLQRQLEDEGERKPMQGLAGGPPMAGTRNKATRRDATAVAGAGLVPSFMRFVTPAGRCGRKRQAAGECPCRGREGEPGRRMVPGLVVPVSQCPPAILHCKVQSNDLG